METLKLKHKILNEALDRLNDSINYLKKLSQKQEEQILDFVKNEDLRRSFRDSLIQRFKFTVDLFWKYIKKYLEFQLEELSEFNSPKAVIRAACKAKILSEKEVESIIEIIKCRNLTSHIYKEEISDRISLNIPSYYKIIKICVDRLTI